MNAELRTTLEGLVVIDDKIIKPLELDSDPVKRAVAKRFRRGACALGLIALSDLESPRENLEHLRESLERGAIPNPSTPAA